MAQSVHSSAQTFVLVHGAGHGGWCYARVAEMLRAKGHRVFTPTLSGLAERARENDRSINLTMHIADIVDLIRFEALDDVILCGHSYGGMVITGAAEKIPERIKHLVYIDAVIPETGKCMTDYVFPGEALVQVLQVVGTLGGGYLLPAPPAAFFNVNEADREMVDRLLTPHPMASLFECITLEGRADSVAGHSFVYATDWAFPMIAPHYERAKSLPGWQVHEVAAGHDIMIDAPERLADILDSVR
jgi:pimeloyl-ACP methyl ester carboxylesterase